jgi:hypothetical protein
MTRTSGIMLRLTPSQFHLAIVVGDVCVYDGPDRSRQSPDDRKVAHDIPFRAGGMIHTRLSGYYSHTLAFV